MEAVHLGIYPYQCSLCGKKFSNRNNLDMHFAAHHTQLEANISCPNCTYKTTKKSNLKRHSKIHAETERVACNVCEYKGRDDLALRTHKRRVHLPQELKKCHLCKKTVTDIHTCERKETLYKHACTKCQKSFSQKGHLKIHIRVHTKEKPYTCLKCSKSFSQGSGLAWHKLACEDIREVPCPLCEKMFRVKSDLEKHTSAVHLIVRKFKSDNCPKAFTDATPLKYHIMAAHGDGSHRFQCSFCDKKIIHKKEFPTTHYKCS